MNAEHQRMMNGTHAPDEKEILDFIEARGAVEAWKELTNFLRDNYVINPEMLFDKRQGWDIRYRKSGKTLVTLTPEKGAVRILMVLGREESARALSMQKDLSPKMFKLIKNTKQLHDGRWLWIRMFEAGDAEDLKRLLPLKRRPRKS